MHLAQIYVSDGDRLRGSDRNNTWEYRQPRTSMTLEPKGCISSAEYICMQSTQGVRRGVPVASAAASPPIGGDGVREAEHPDGNHDVVADVRLRTV